MVKKLFFVIAVTSALLLSSCMSTKTQVGRYREIVKVENKDTYNYSKGKQVYFLWGFFPMGRTQVATPEHGNCQIKTRHGALDMLVTVLTGGIFSMQTIKVKAPKVLSNTNSEVAQSSNQVEEPTTMAEESKDMVSRDAPGATDLERTVIRWFFDSDPRGARIYWRVISSIPSIVKNTNETYLMTTPFEETRSFNILGLTYENSRDVQIEIKVSKKGYEDQVKRFNVRQAIDQQEISGFFEMIAKK